MQTSTGPYEHSTRYTTRQRQLPISDKNHHVTETIGYMYDDDYDQRHSKYLSYIPSSMNESLSVLPYTRENLQTPSDPDNLQQSLPIRTSSIDRAGENGHNRQPMAEKGSTEPMNGGQLSSMLTRSPSSKTSKSIPLDDIDYESNPAAVAQELNNLAALRRMSLDVGAADPDFPSFGANFGVPPIPPSAPSDSNDASQLFWVPARLHPGLAPKEFKSFLDGKAEQLKRRSGELSMTDSGLQIQGSTGGLRRRKSMLSRQIDTSGSGSQNEEGGLDAVSEEPSTVQGNGNDLMLDDKPILPPAPPGHSLRRSTRTTYRRGSLKTGERIPYSRRAPRNSNSDAEAMPQRSPPSCEDDLPILRLTRVSTDPVHGPGASGYSRPVTRTQPDTSSTATHGFSAFDSLRDAASDHSSSGTRSLSSSQSQTWSSQVDHSGQRISETPTAGQNVPQIIETHPTDSKESAPTSPLTSTQSHIPARKSSHDPPPSQPPQTPLLPEPTGSRSSKRAALIKQPRESYQTVNEIASHQTALSGNTTKTDTLSFIPTLTDHSNKRSDSKKSKDKKDGEGSRKSSWTWLRGSEEKDKEKKKEEESKKSKSRLPKITEKAHDNTRLDVLQTSIDGAQKGRESVIIDRAEIKLEEERRKDHAKKSLGIEQKKEKETSLFSSFFGGKKKGHHDSGHRKHSGRNYSPETLPRELKPDIDYHWTRFPIAKEREIYRDAHWKLANPKRPLHSQVLLSNFMYSYLAKVQQMHPTLSLGPSALQTQQRKLETTQSEDHSQYQRYQQGREHDRYNKGNYYNDSQLYDYDGDDRDDHQWSLSGGHCHSQNGSIYGPGHQPPQYASHSSFGDDPQLDDDDDMW
ncbi:hypothetical protein ACO22_01490 [Paracoccidioides brasiliensis]|uniref:Protein Zds1 C-terminal domain-containing protein n=1 Tax=Paracoccidioides brasiliensis TaxID=121759 RepID=A0A1D2JLB6_PARBR|nr:hypothetical protein ACO22_01490 [Paracoccidioides brasiliensis]